ncbi:hypothetical protein PRIPAC_79382 [Pristionchus pacificus]|uniref:Uncharacterized protein n=1 Tax=Pristionchus pacificus TaxID=54126 RepID=A0A2A6CNF0_PRIPA|nr:hypothetical protein PRIPAC_79382 [Pristionchus pacificus]|eukprot:PDM79724.1 hypothetical protein PRIPAC_32303 [Pristionchus pacificus]
MIQSVPSQPALNGVNGGVDDIPHSEVDTRMEVLPPTLRPHPRYHTHHHIECVGRRRVSVPERLDHHWRVHPVSGVPQRVVGGTAPRGRADGDRAELRMGEALVCESNLDASKKGFPTWIQVQYSGLGNPTWIQADSSCPVASSTHLAYKVLFRISVLTAFGHECDRLPTSPVGPYFGCDRPDMV